MHIKETASKAMFALLSKGRVLQLPVDIMLEMFNKTVLPIMLYGCEVWGFGKNDMLDTVFLKFCKYLLGLKIMYSKLYGIWWIRLLPCLRYYSN